MAIAMKRGLQETIHLVMIELIKKCNYRVSMLGKPANIKYWLFCHKTTGMLPILLMQINGALSSQGSWRVAM